MNSALRFNGLSAHPGAFVCSSVLLMWTNTDQHADRTGSRWTRGWCLSLLYLQSQGLEASDEVWNFKLWLRWLSITVRRAGCQSGSGPNAEFESSVLIVGYTRSVSDGTYLCFNASKLVLEVIGFTTFTSNKVKQSCSHSPHSYWSNKYSKGTFSEPQWLGREVAIKTERNRKSP